MRYPIHMRTTPINAEKPKVVCGQDITHYQVETGERKLTNDWNYVTCVKCIKTKEG